MKKEVYLIYKTDNWHSYASWDLIGVATTEDIAISLCKKRATTEHARIDKDQLFNLGNINQTQGYSGEGEFVIQIAEIDTLF
jgi:hypothetical protein